MNLNLTKFSHFHGISCNFREKILQEIHKIKGQLRDTIRSCIIALSKKTRATIVGVHSPLVTTRVTQLQTQRGRSPTPHGVNLQHTTHTFSHHNATAPQKPVLLLILIMQMSIPCPRPYL